MRAGLLAIVFSILIVFLVFLGLFLVLGSVRLPSSGCVGLIHLNGVITTQSSDSLFSDSGVSSDEFEELAREANERPDVKAVLFEIDSPGGSVVASDEIYLAMRNIDKPKVAYIREMGASGGYYVAMGSDYIMSHPAAITGSIGVRTTFADLSGLFEKIGLNETTIVSGDKKNMGENKPLTDDEMRIINETIIMQVFNGFKSLVLERRAGKIDLTREDEIFDARIMTGRTALSYGLIDALGSVDDAIKKAAELGGIEEEEPRICELSNEETVFESMFKSLSKHKEQVSVEYR